MDSNRWFFSALNGLPKPWAGCDEAGRGCLAGPVVAGVVVLPEHYMLPSLKDSKQLTAQQREALAIIIKKQAVGWAMGSATPQEVDRYNVLEATFLAMHRAIKALLLRCKPQYLLVDGNRFKPYKDLKHVCIVQGDAQVPCIAAASILAKTRRDAIMRDLAYQYPDYGWESNKGYPTRYHRRVTLEKGLTLHHRTSFRVAD